MLTVIETMDGRVLVTDKVGKELLKVIKEAREDMVELFEDGDIRDAMTQTKGSYVLIARGDLVVDMACRVARL